MQQITIHPRGRGHFIIYTTYKRKLVWAVTTNTLAIDRYRDESSPAKAHKDGGLTRAQAAKVLHNEIVRKNFL